MRVRPKLMTVFTLLVGLAPIFLTEGFGSDVMRRIALPMLGGMASTLILTLIVIPAIYYIRTGFQLSARPGAMTDDAQPGLAEANGDLP
jgi:Cu(I)/Ag(I) efflux system membrane protein CusA/SilA